MVDMYYPCFVRIVMPFYIHIHRCCFLPHTSLHVRLRCKPHPPLQIPVVFGNVKWEQEHEDELVQILKRPQEEVLPPYGKHVSHITDKLSNRLCDGTVYTVKQVEGKIKLLKELYVNFSDFVHDKVGTGCGWDDDLGTVTGTSEQWEHIQTVSHYVYVYHFLIKYLYVLTNRQCYTFCA